MLEDIKGRKMQAIEVFSACIKYLKEHLENTCKLACPDLKLEDIRWVLTVPAIWNDASKQFMREAAEKVLKYERLFFLLLLRSPHSSVGQALACLSSGPGFKTRQKQKSFQSQTGFHFIQPFISTLPSS